MEILAECWKQMVSVFGSTLITGVLAAAMQNKDAGHDWKPSARFGAVTGVVCGLICAGFVIIEKTL